MFTVPHILDLFVFVFFCLPAMSNMATSKISFILLLIFHRVMTKIIPKVIIYSVEGD